MHGASESDLVAAAVRGDETAIQRLLASEYDRIWAVCRRILGNNADADDATQDALIRIVKSLPNFDQRSKFSTWAYRIASNCAIDETRRRTRRRRADSLDKPRPDGRVLEVADRFAQQNIEHVADRDAFEAALARVDDDYRVPLILRDVGTLSYAEIAEQLGLPEGTVKSRIARGRRQLLESISGNQTGARVVKPTSLEP